MTRLSPCLLRVVPLMLCFLSACGGGGSPYPDVPPTTLGDERPARLYVPDDYDPEKAYPLVMMLHGFGVNGVLQDGIFGFRERVSREQFVLVVPEGTSDTRGRRFWNASPECCNFDGLEVDDVAYLTGLIEEVAAVVHIDRARIAVAGHSNGGYMSMRLACERPDLIRRVASLAGSMPVDEASCEAREGAVSFLHIHGTLDLTVPYHDNREGTPGEQHGIISRGALDTVARWRARNGCADEPDREETADFLTSVAGDETTLQRWERCAEGTHVSFWRGEGGDHLYLGRNAAFQDRLVAFLVGAP